MLLTTLATLGSIGTAIVGAVRGADLSRQNKALLKEDENLLRSRIRQDYTKRSQFVGGMTKQKELLDNYTQAEQGRNSVIGGYNPSVMAQKGANQRTLENMGNTLAMNAENAKESAENALVNVRSQQRQVNTQSQANVAQGVGTALYGLGSLADADNGEDVLDMFGIGKRRKDKANTNTNGQ